MNWDTAPEDIARLTAEVERLKLECSIRDAMLAEGRGELAASKSAFDALAVQHADRMTQLYAAQADDTALKRYGAKLLRDKCATFTYKTAGVTEFQQGYDLGRQDVLMALNDIADELEKS
jgi:hypothetical protein